MSYTFSPSLEKRHIFHATNIPNAYVFTHKTRIFRLSDHVKD